MSEDLVLPSAGPRPVAADDALAAVLGYARGRRPLRFRAPNAREGRWVQVRAFAFDRFDAQRAETGGAMTDRDVLLAEGLHGRLDPRGWTAVRAALDAARPVVDATLRRAGGRAFWQLEPEEFSVLAEPGTTGAAVRALAGGPHGHYVLAAAHHRHPELFPLLDGITRRQLWPHTAEGDSGVHAVVARELRRNGPAFAVLADRVDTALGCRLSPLRLHDVLLWLAGSLRWETALAEGRRCPEWLAAGAVAGGVTGAVAGVR